MRADCNKSVTTNARRRHTIRALDQLSGPGHPVFASYVVLDAIAKPTLGQVGPAYMNDEAGILVTAIFWLVVAAILIRTRVGANATPAR
jgi:hypothetical protein